SQLLHLLAGDLAGNKNCPTNRAEHRVLRHNAPAIVTCKGEPIEARVLDESVGGISLLTLETIEFQNGDVAEVAYADEKFLLTIRWVIQTDDGFRFGGERKPGAND
ncbi:MAG: PilZ domain-containing protein, partial [Planctomycetales bacterium]|nr:PilZ domain-containing protein [Planctomycetales bacterium]